MTRNQEHVEASCSEAMRQMFVNCRVLEMIPEIIVTDETFREMESLKNQIKGPRLIFVLLKCWYEGDSNLVEDSFVACGDIENLKRLVPSEAELFMPGEDVPDDGQYGDKRERFRIAVAPLLE